MEEEKGKGGLQWILDLSGYAIVLLVLGVYVFWGMLEVVDKEKTIREIILAGGLAWILGFSIARVLERQGIIHGNNNKSVIHANNVHADTVEKVYPFIDECDEWCNMKNKNALFIKREKILRKNGLKYDKYFDKEGDFIEGSIVFPEPKNKQDKKAQKRKKAAIQEAIDATITPLTPSTLTTSYTGDEYDPFNFGKGIDSYIRKSSFKDAASKVATAVIFGYYGLKMMQDFQWGDLLWTGIQAGSFLISGFMKEISALLYVIQNCKINTYRKVDKLKEFEVWHNKKGAEKK